MVTEGLLFMIRNMYLRILPWVLTLTQITNAICRLQSDDLNKCLQFLIQIHNGQHIERSYNMLVVEVNI